LRECWRNNEKLPTGYDLRDIINNSSPEWVKSAPFNPRGAAILDAREAFRNCQDKYNPRFRSCRESNQSLKLQKSNFSGGMTYRRKLGKFNLNPSEPLPTKIDSDFSIVLSNGRWFICFCEQFEAKQSNLNNAIALDPGVRTFVTGFDGRSILEYGIGNFSRIAQICHRLDKVQSKLTTLSGSQFKRERWKLRKLACQLRVKITNLVSEVHNQVAASLTNAFKHIFLPTFKTSQMVKKKRRKIGSKTARAMLSWSHYRFKQVLRFHALKRGSIVHDVTEEYTSKTCSKCGHIHQKLGGNKKFKCPECGHTINRDWNGAINILYKSLNGLANPSPGLDDAQYTIDFSTCY